MDYELKVVIVGKAYVGKTTLMNTFVMGNFYTHHCCTVSVSYKYSIIKIDNMIVKLHFFDTGGEERFQNHLSPIICRNVDMLIAAYDIADKSSFDVLSHWIDDVKEKSGKPFDLTIVGTKSDLHGRRKVHSQEGLDYAASLGAPFFEVSSKKNKNIQELFTAATSGTIHTIQEEKQLNAEKLLPTIPSSNTKWNFKNMIKIIFIGITILLMAIIIVN